MKTIEEKAKAHDEALERARQIARQGGASRYLVTQIFPQLAENEDERIRKAIMGLTYIDGIEPILTKCSITAQDIRKYLEKQKDAKSKYAGMIVVSQEEWNSAIADAFKHGMDEGKKQKKQKPVINDEQQECPYKDLVLVKNFFGEYKRKCQLSNKACDSKKCKQWNELQSEFKNINEAFEDGKNEVIANPEKYGLQKEQKAAESCSTCVESEYDKGYKEGVKYALEKTGHYTIGNTFMGLIPCWVNAPSELQPAHKYHGRNAVIMHENNGGFRCCFIDDKEATTVHLPEDTLFVEGWRKRPEECSEESEKVVLRKKVVLKAVSFLNSYGNSLYNEGLEKESNAVYKIADSLKLLDIQPKQEWSEEDKLTINAAIYWIMRTLKIEKVFDISTEYSPLSMRKTAERLKSLRLQPEPFWKPKEEQIEAVRYFVNKHQPEAWAATGQWRQFIALRELLGDLQRLM